MRCSAASNDLARTRLEGAQSFGSMILAAGVGATHRVGRAIARCRCRGGIFPAGPKQFASRRAKFEYSRAQMQEGTRAHPTKRTGRIRSRTCRFWRLDGCRVLAVPGHRRSCDYAVAAADGFRTLLLAAAVSWIWMRARDGGAWLRYLLGALVVLMGVALVYLGDHWASEVVGGFLLASVAVALLRPQRGELARTP